MKEYEVTLLLRTKYIVEAKDADTAYDYGLEECEVDFREFDDIDNIEVYEVLCVS